MVQAASMFSAVAMMSMVDEAEEVGRKKTDDVAPDGREDPWNVEDAIFVSRWCRREFLS